MADEGRPTKYSPGMIRIVEEYTDSCGREATELPTIEGAALKLQVDTDTIDEWVKIYPEFSGAIKRLMMKQKSQCMNDGAYGGKEVNPGMLIFLLKANHGMIETEKKIIAGDDKQPINIKIVEAQELE